MLIDAHLVLIPLLLFFAAIFAAAEASLFSLSRPQLESLREARPHTYRRIRRLVFEPEALLSTLIIGNECLNIMIATFVVTLLQTHLPFEQTVIGVLAVVLSSILLLTFSEVLPKVLAFRLPLQVASVLVYPTSWAHTLLTPFRQLFLFVSERIINVFGITPSPPAVVSEKDFLTLVEVGAESGSLDRDEKERIINVFHFTDLTVSAVMTPWKHVFFITDEQTMSDVLSKVRTKTFSRIPVLSHDDQHVVGILYTKELLKHLLEESVVGTDALTEAISPPHVVSSHKKISKLFREFKLKKVHMALVVDEYGRHIGVVTLEDLLNALFRTTRRKEVVVP